MAESHNLFPSSSAFPNSISEKLDDSNFLLWRQQIDLVIKSHRLQCFVVNPVIPPQFLSDADREIGNENPAYEIWEQHDQILLAWLQLTLSKSILLWCLVSIQTYQVWDKIHKYFNKQTRAQAWQLHSELQSTLLKDRSMRAFLLKVQEILNTLASVGSPISPQENVDALIEGLPRGYSLVISINESKLEPLPIAEVEALLLAHEAQLRKFDELPDPPSVNLTHTYGANTHSA